MVWVGIITTTLSCWSRSSKPKITRIQQYSLNMSHSSYKSSISKGNGRSHRSSFTWSVTPRDCQLLSVTQQCKEHLKSNIIFISGKSCFTEECDQLATITPVFKKKEKKFTLRYELFMRASKHPAFIQPRYTAWSPLLMINACVPPFKDLNTCTSLRVSRNKEVNDCCNRSYGHYLSLSSNHHSLGLVLLIDQLQNLYFLHLNSCFK